MYQCNKCLKTVPASDPHSNSKFLKRFCVAQTVSTLTRLVFSCPVYLVCSTLLNHPEWSKLFSHQRAHRLKFLIFLLLRFSRLSKFVYQLYIHFASRLYRKSKVRSALIGLYRPPPHVCLCVRLCVCAPTSSPVLTLSPQRRTTTPRNWSFRHLTQRRRRWSCAAQHFPAFVWNWHLASRVWLLYSTRSEKATVQQLSPGCVCGVTLPVPSLYFRPVAPVKTLETVKERLGDGVRVSLNLSANVVSQTWYEMETIHSYNLKNFRHRVLV